jgi:hypothetical protein
VDKFRAERAAMRSVGPAGRSQRTNVCARRRCRASQNASAALNKRCARTLVPITADGMHSRVPLCSLAESRLRQNQTCVRGAAERSGGGRHIHTARMCNATALLRRIAASRKNLTDFLSQLQNRSLAIEAIFNSTHAYARPGFAPAVAAADWLARPLPQQPHARVPPRVGQAQAAVVRARPPRSPARSPRPHARFRPQGQAAEAGGQAHEEA